MLSIKRCLKHFIVYSEIVKVKQIEWTGSKSLPCPLTIDLLFNDGEQETSFHFLLRLLKSYFHSPVHHMSKCTSVHESGDGKFGWFLYLTEYYCQVRLFKIHYQILNCATEHLGRINIKSCWWVLRFIAQFQLRKWALWMLSTRKTIFLVTDMNITKRVANNFLYSWENHFSTSLLRNFFFAADPH